MPRERSPIRTEAIGQLAAAAAAAPVEENLLLLMLLRSLCDRTDYGLLRQSFKGMRWAALPIDGLRQSFLVPKEGAHRGPKEGGRCRRVGKLLLLLLLRGLKEISYWAASEGAGGTK
jgi:hypothetical protein